MCQIASEWLEANFLDLQAINFPHSFCRSNQIHVFDSNNGNAHSWLNWFIHVRGIQFASKLERHFFSLIWDVKSCSCVKLCIVYGWTLLCCAIYEYIRDWGCWYFLILGFVSATANNDINMWLIYMYTERMAYTAQTIRKIEGSSLLLYEYACILSFSILSIFSSNKKRCLSQAHFILRIFFPLCGWFGIEVGDGN